MPIYYSIDKTVCMNYLLPMSEEMREELPSYGLECSDARLSPAPIAINYNTASMDAERANGISESFVNITFALVWVILLIVILIGGLQCKRYCDEGSERASKKRIELV